MNPTEFIEYHLTPTAEPFVMSVLSFGLSLASLYFLTHCLRRLFTMSESPSIKVRFSPGLLAAVDSHARKLGCDRSEAVRLLVHCGYARWYGPSPASFCECQAENAPPNEGAGDERESARQTPES